MSQLPHSATIIALLSTVTPDIAIALGNLRRRGYAVTTEDGRIAIRTPDGKCVHTTTKWASALQFLLEAPRMTTAAPGATSRNS